jgi:DNA-binding MarR family transcriptional regulator
MAEPILSPASPALPVSQTIESLNLWSKILISGMRQAKFDLSTRQTAILLSIYLDSQTHSVKTLAEQLGISKPAICRAVDVLCHEGLIKRKRSETDKRLVSLTKTIKGMIFLSDMAEVIHRETAEKTAEKTTEKLPETA